MATTPASPCVRSVTIPRCITDRDWWVTDMAVRGNKLAVCGYNHSTYTQSYIDLFTLNDPDSSSPLMTQLFTKVFNHPTWRYRRVSFLDDSRIVTLHRDLVQVYHIEADDSEPLHTVNLLHDRKGLGVTVREGKIFIGLSSNEVIVFDFRLNEIKTITLKGLVGLVRHDYPTDITVYGDNLCISTASRWRAIRYNMEGTIVHEYKAPVYSFACSIAVSGLVYILWDHRHVVGYSLSDSQQLMSFNVDYSYRIRIVDVNRLLTVDDTGEVREYSMTQLCTFENLKRTLCRVMSPIDCAELKRYFKITDLDMSTNGNESRDIVAGAQDDHAAHLLAILETKGFIGSDNLDGLKKAFQHLGTAHVSMLRSQLESFQLHSKPSEEHSDRQSTPEQDSHIWKSLDRFSTRGKWKVDDLAVEVPGKIIVSGHGIQDRGIFLDKISPVTVRKDTGLLTIECSAEFSYEGNADNKNCDDDGNNSDEDSSDNSSVDSMSDYSDRYHFTSIIDESRIVSCQGKTLKILSLNDNTEVPLITLNGIASCVEVRGSDILVGYKSYSPDPQCIDVFDSALKKKCSIKLKDLHRRASVIDLSLLAGKLLVLTHKINTLESDVCLFDGDGNKLLKYSPPLGKEWVAKSVAVNDTYQMVAILWSDRWDEDKDEDEDGTCLSFHLMDSGLCLCCAKVNQACKLRFMNSEEVVLVSSEGQISSFKKTYFFSYNNLIHCIMKSLDFEVGWNILWQFFAVSADERTKIIADSQQMNEEKLAKRFLAFLDEKIDSSSQRFAALLKALTELERCHAFALLTCIDYYKCLSSGTGQYNDQPYQLLHYYGSSVPFGETAATQRQIQSVDDVPGTSNSSPSMSVPSRSEIRSTGPSTYYPASTNNSAPKRRTPPYSGANVEPHNKRKPPDVLTPDVLHESLQKVFAEMTRSDSENLANFFMFPLKHVKAIINSPSHSKDLLVELENKGIIQSALTDELCENLKALNILTGGNWKPPDTMKITSSISGKGGLLQFPNTGIKLVFPPNAVTEEHNIQVKIIPPSLSYGADTILSSNSSVVLQLLPNGLQLKREISLTLTHCLTFINEEKAKAKIYVSHHEEGQTPRWEERPLSPYIFHRSKCTVRLLGFCWLKVIIDDTEVEAKNLVVFAAKKILRNKRTAKVEVGYYENIPERGEPNILKLNPGLKPELCLQLKCMKEGKQPLTISFNGTDPDDTWYIKQGKAKQEISWQSIALSEERFVPFVLHRRKNMDSFCNFSVQQGNHNPIKFEIGLEVDLSTVEIFDSKVPDSILNELARKLTGEWQMLARELNISEFDLYNIKENNTGNIVNTKYLMLSHWNKMNGTGATCRVLAEALRKVNRRDLKEFVEKEVTMQGRNEPTQDS